MKTETQTQMTGAPSGALCSTEGCDRPVYVKKLKLCLPCYGAKYYVKNRKKIKARNAKWNADNPEKAKATRAKRDRSITGRHRRCERAMKRDNKRSPGLVPENDLLWNIHFYAELIRDNKCHYCKGPLNETGFGLDAADNELGHVWYNVVPCCRGCNVIKGDRLSYEQMMRLSTILREFVKEESLTT